MSRVRTAQVVFQCVCGSYIATCEVAQVVGPACCKACGALWDVQLGFPALIRLPRYLPGGMALPHISLGEQATAFTWLEVDWGAA